MIADTRAALAAVQEELRQLDGRLAAADGAADPLAVAKALIALDKIKAKVGNLSAALAPAGPDAGRPRRR